MKERQMGLKFLLTGGQWFAAVMSEREALDYIDRWQRGVDALEAVLGGPKEKWAIKVGQIVGMHLIELEADKQQPPASVPNYNPYGYNPSRS